MLERRALHDDSAPIQKQKHLFTLNLCPTLPWRAFLEL